MASLKAQKPFIICRQVVCRGQNYVWRLGLEIEFIQRVQVTIITTSQYCCKKIKEKNKDNITNNIKHNYMLNQYSLLIRENCKILNRNQAVIQFRSQCHKLEFDLRQLPTNHIPISCCRSTFWVFHLESGFVFTVWSVTVWSQRASDF